MKRMDNSFQCCIEDGSRPTAYVVQTKYANHLKVLCSKDTVLNVQAKGSAKRGQVRVRKLNESEPTEDMSKRLLVVKSIDPLQSIGQTAAVICLPAAEQPALRRQDLYTGFYTKRERLTC